MKKSELIDKIGRIYSKFEDFQADIETLKQDAKKLDRMIGELPGEVDEIEDDDKDDTETEELANSREKEED